jgi:spore coat polysaccharide biosynthesis predicted glycosyltransferase SpsG
LGLPTIQIVIAKNQQFIAEMLAKDNVIQLLEDIDNLSELVETAQIWMSKISQKSSEICDSLGTDKIVAVLMNESGL